MTASDMVRKLARRRHATWRRPRPQPPGERLDYWPPELVAAVDELVLLWDGWDWWLAEEYADDGSGGLAGGLKLFVISQTPNSYNLDESIAVRHEFLVPRASYNRRTWIAWLFDRYCDVWIHEAGETFLVDGVRMLGPHHANGENPYRPVLVDGGDLVDTKVRAGESREQYLSRQGRS